MFFWILQRSSQRSKWFQPFVWIQNSKYRWFKIRAINKVWLKNYSWQRAMVINKQIKIITSTKKLKLYIMYYYIFIFVSSRYVQDRLARLRLVWLGVACGQSVRDTKYDWLARTELLLVCTILVTFSLRYSFLLSCLRNSSHTSHPCHGPTSPPPA